MELYAQVRRSVIVEGLSEREAVKRFGLARETVRKMLRYKAPPGYRRRQPVKRPKLDSFTGIIDQILLDDQQQPRKQRHTAQRIFDRLRDEYDFTGGYTIIKEAQNQSSRHGPPSGGPDFQRPSNRAPATRVGVSKSLLGRCLCGFEASRTRRASTTSARRDRARPGVVSCSRFSSGATRNGEMRRQIGW